MLHPANAQELAQIARELGALILRGYLQYPGPTTGDWEIAGQNLPDLLYQLRERQVLLILAPVDGEPVHAPLQACAACAGLCWRNRGSCVRGVCW